MDSKPVMDVAVHLRRAAPRAARRSRRVARAMARRASDRGRMVAAGYDRIAERYSRWAERIEGDPCDRIVAAFAARLPAGARVLDLGCGPGIPSTRALAERFEVTGIDISEKQIELARANVPGATLVHGDFTGVDLPDGSFEGVAAFYAVSHVPRAEHARLFARIARWLVPGGVFVASLGVADSPDWVGEWLGAEMFFSSFDADTNRALLRAAGFDLLLDEIVEMREPEGPASFLWVTARKSATRRAASAPDLPRSAKLARTKQSSRGPSAA